MKVENKQCFKGKFGSDELDTKYAILDEALDECRKVTECAGVYDKGCDDKGPFHLCPTGSIHHATLQSCSHYKLSNYLPLFLILISTNDFIYKCLFLLYKKNFKVCFILRHQAQILVIQKAFRNAPSSPKMKFVEQI
jgi:hypothetical protein